MRGTWGVGVSWGLTIEHIRQKLWLLVLPSHSQVQNQPQIRISFSCELCEYTSLKLSKMDIHKNHCIHKILILVVLHEIHKLINYQP